LISVYTHTFDFQISGLDEITSSHFPLEHLAIGRGSPALIATLLFNLRVLKRIQIICSTGTLGFSIFRELSIMASLEEVDVTGSTCEAEGLRMLKEFNERVKIVGVPSLKETG
jgi:hypothetical protein